MARPDLHTRAVPFTRPLLENQVSRGVYSGVRRNVPRCWRRFLILCGSHAGVLEEALFPSPARIEVEFESAGGFTVRLFPQHLRYGPRRGLLNPGFLDAGLFEAAFLEPLSPHLDRVAVVILEFGTFSRDTYPEPQVFFEDLGAFLGKLPGNVQYSVEIRNEDFLCAQYFDVLRSHGVAHVFNSWTRMPSLAEQLQIENAFTAPHAVARALLRP